MTPVFRTASLGTATLVVATVALGMGIGMGPRHGGGTGGMGGSGGMGMGGPGNMMGPPPSLGENPLQTTDDVVAKGKSLYDANCAVCHGPLGRGDGPGAAGLNPPPPDLRGRAASWSDGEIAAQIQTGRGAMPPFRAVLDDAGMWSVVRYMRRLQGR